jgi:hypothetical protein
MPTPRQRHDGAAGSERDEAGAASQPSTLTDATRVLALQRSHGNVAVGRMLQAGGPQVQRVKDTEKEAMKGGDTLSDKNASALVDKVNTTGQSLERAREIAGKVELESEALVASLPVQQAKDVRAAVKNYIASSTAIQTAARADDDADVALTMLTAALETIRAQMTQKQKQRIVYRSISYDSVADIPYGRTGGGTTIAEGDIVGDKGFLSTSEHRQFVLGKTQTAAIGGILRLAIHSTEGVPIALHFDAVGYSNQNAKLVHDMAAPKNELKKAWNKAFGPGPEAGQAEVLFARNSRFIVKKIDRSATGVTAVLEDCGDDDDGAAVNMKTGDPL